jgi:tetratricopeptide (TPR) repeat protein
MLRSVISVYLLVLLSAACPEARAQEQSSPPTTAQKSAPKPARAPADDKSPPAAPATDAEQTPKKSSADENPFPEEQSKSAAKQVEEGQAPPLPADLAGESPSGKASGSRPDASDAQPGEEGVSSSRTRLEGLDQADPDAKRKVLPKVSDPVHNPKMSAEDVAIGKMYFQSENYRGAYIRYKEALSLDPENPDAAFGVAETARKLNQTKEAIENYRLCLDLDPNGPRAKASRKALNALSSVSTH